MRRWPGLARRVPRSRAHGAELDHGARGLDRCHGGRHGEARTAGIVGRLMRRGTWRRSCTRRGTCRSQGRWMRTGTSSNRPTCGRPTSSRSTATGRCGSCSTSAGLEELEIGGQRSTMSRRGFPSTLGAMGAPDIAAMRKDPERTYLAEAPFGAMDPDERRRGPRRRAHRRGRPVHDGRPAVGGRARGSRAGAGVHPGLQPLDLRVLRRRRRGSCRPPTCRSSDPGGGGPELERAVGEGAKRRLRRPVHPRRPSRSATPTTTPVFAAAQDLDVPLRHPPDVRAAVDEGHAHGRVGATSSSSGCSASVTGIRRRAPPVHDAVRLRRVRQVPAA